GVDAGWTGWNLVSGAFSLEATIKQEWFQETRFPDHRLEVLEIKLRGCPVGITAQERAGEIRYRTRFFQIGFRLGRTGFSYLGLDDEGLGRTHRDLLQQLPIRGKNTRWP